jgi:hypothetical protein
VALLRAFWVLMILALAGVLAAADEPPLKATADVDTRRVAVGDTFNLYIDLDWKDRVDVKPLAVGDQLGNFVVRDIRRTLASRVGDRFNRRISMLLTVFETGRQWIPPVPIVLIDEGGNVGKVETDSISISVESILPAEAADIRDIKDPIRVPKKWRDLILSYALLLGLAGGAALSVLVSVRRKEEIETLLQRLWRRVTAPVRRFVLWLLNVLGLRRVRPGPSGFDVRADEPGIIPEEAALRELERIQALGLRERGMIKDYYSLVSETLRRYAERKYGVLAMESPTSYTIAAISELNLPWDGYSLLQEVLEESDLVKFAKFVPGEATIDSLLERTRRIIYLTGTQPTRAEMDLEAE